MTDIPKHNVRLLLEYDGARFRGWQVQPGERTVQGELEARLAALLGHSVRTTASGRTDTGVHALGQVVNFRTGRSLPSQKILQALNAKLPSDIRVLSAEEAAEDFNARRHARSRRYVYRIEYRPRAVGRGLAWVHCQRLDVAAMQRAADHLVGKRSFASFCIAASEREDHQCDLRVCRWEEKSDGIQFTTEANRYLRGMVRSIVGTLVQVGRGVRSPDEIPGILEAGDRSAAGPTAPPQGLFLDSVTYG